MLKKIVFLAFAMVCIVVGTVQAAELTLYCGRGEPLVQPVLDQFQRETGIKVNVRYGGTAQLAVLVQEEGQRSSADLFWGQDSGAMGALANAGLLRQLPPDVYKGLPSIYVSKTGQWVATSGRARVIAYSSARINNAELPKTVFDLAQERYRGRMALPPSNGSFQSFVTAMRVLHGDAKTLEWLKAIKANEPKIFTNNAAALTAIADGEADFALINSYYLPRFKMRDQNFPAAQAFFADGDAGNLVNVAGIAILKSSSKQDEALRLVRYLLSPAAQQYFTSVVGEYAVVQGIISNPVLTDMSLVQKAAPQIDLDKLADLNGTLNLLRESGLL